MADFADDIFKSIFFNKIWILIKISPKFVPMHGSNKQYAIIGSDNGVAPIRRQAINLKQNDDLVYWRICVTRPQWVNRIRRSLLGTCSAPFSYLNRYRTMIDLDTRNIFLGNLVISHQNTHSSVVRWRFGCRLLVRECPIVPAKPRFHSCQYSTPTCEADYPQIKRSAFLPWIAGYDIWPTTWWPLQFYVRWRIHFTKTQRWR